MEKFVLRSDPPFERYQIDNKYIPVNILKLLHKKTVFRPRGMEEAWDVFEKRMEKALRQIKEIIFGELVTESAKFEFLEMPSRYGDYQWMKNSEIHINEYSFMMSVSLDNSLDIDSEKMILFDCPCIETELIWSLFSFEEKLLELLMNASNYINYQSAQNNVVCDFWMTRTGMKGRTKLIESTEIGEHLIIKSCEENHITREYDVCLSDGRIIGEISRHGDFPQQEYERVYKKLEEQGDLRILGATLKEVIPHGTPKGKPRKAMAKIGIEYECAGQLKLYEMPTAYFQECANTMNILAKVDYNRKLEIIEGIRRDKSIWFSETFSTTGKLNCSDYQLLTRQPLRKFKLDSIHLSPMEAEEFWDVFCSAYHCDSFDSNRDTCGGLVVGQFLNHSCDKLSFEIEVCEEFNAWDNRILVPYLSVYRNAVTKH